MSVIDTTSNAVVNRYQIGASAALAITANGEQLYVGSAEVPFQVAALDTRTGEVAAAFVVPGLVSSLALTPDESRLWVSHTVRCQITGECVGAAGITVFDTASHAAVESVRDGGMGLRGYIAFDALGGTAYSSNYRGVLAIDTATYAVTAERPVICCVSGELAVHPNGHTVYVLGNEFGGFIGVADLRRPIDYAPAFFVMGQSGTELNFQSDIAFSPDGMHAYLPGSINSAGALFIMDTSDPWAPTLETVLDLEARPTGIALTGDGVRAYLTNQNSSVTVVEIGSGRLVTTIPLQSEPARIVIGRNAAPPPESSGSAKPSGGCQVTAVGRNAFVLRLLLAAAGILWSFHRSHRGSARVMPRRMVEAFRRVRVREGAT